MSIRNFQERDICLQKFQVWIGLEIVLRIAILFSYCIYITLRQFLRTKMMVNHITSLSIKLMAYGNE